MYSMTKQGSKLEYYNPKSKALTIKHRLSLNSQGKETT